MAVSMDTIIHACFLACMLACASGQELRGRRAGRNAGPVLGPERVVFQTDFGEFELGFYTQDAPQTAQHILRLAQLGAYISDNFSIVEKDFYVQLDKVSTGRSGPLTDQMSRLDNVTLPLEVSDALSHETGMVTLARDVDKDNGSSSFAILVTDAPHLDGQYTVFGKVTAGMGVLFEVEDVKTELVGRNMAPKQRVSILSSYWYTTAGNEATCDFAAVV